MLVGFLIVVVVLLQVRKIRMELQKAVTIPVSQISTIAGQENAKNPTVMNAFSCRDFSRTPSIQFL